MRIIGLKNSKETALVDEADFPKLGGLNWFLLPARTKYAYRVENGKTIYMHREILRAQKNELVDHANGDGLDNRRENLRLCSHSQNMQNRKMGKNNTSGYRGVHFVAQRGKWRVQIRIGGKRIYLGDFHDKIKAAEKYNSAAQTLFKGFARLNQFPL